MGFATTSPDCLLMHMCPVSLRSSTINVIRSSGNMPCCYAQALVVHFPLVCTFMRMPRETPKVEKGYGNNTAGRVHSMLQGGLSSVDYVFLLLLFLFLYFFQPRLISWLWEPALLAARHPLSKPSFAKSPASRRNLYALFPHAHGGCGGPGEFLVLLCDLASVDMVGLIGACVKASFPAVIVYL